MFEFLSVEGQPQCLLLVGQYGVGKTSAINDLYYRFLNGKREFIWMYVDVNERRNEISENPASLIAQLLEVSATAVTDHLKTRAQTRDQFFSDVFENDRAFSHHRLLGTHDSAAQAKLVAAELKASMHLFLNVNLRFLTRAMGNYKVVLVIDNLDSDTPEVQFAGVKQAADLASGCKLKAIIPVRRSTEAQLRYSHRDVFAPFVQTAVQPPDMIEVVRKRVKQALETQEAQNATLGEGALRARVSDCPEFAEVLVQGLSAPAVARLLQEISNESVREALHVALHVYSSHFLDAHRIIRKISPASRISHSYWHGHLPYYMVIKALLLRNWPVYRPDVSWIGNILSTSVPGAIVSPFLRVHMLSLLNHFYPEEMRVRDFEEIICGRLSVDPASVELELKWLRKHDWVEQPDPDHLLMTIRGHYIRFNLLFDPEYLTHIATDVRMYPEMVHRLEVPADSMQQRINNLLTLVEFLLKREAELFKELSKDRIRLFFEHFGRGAISKEIIIEVQKRIASIDVEDDEHREEVRRKAEDRLHGLTQSAEWKTVEQILGRY